MSCDNVRKDYDFVSLRRKWSERSKFENISSANIKKVKGKFGLAWIALLPDGNRKEVPLGWQVEFEDTPLRVSQKCKALVNWVNNPPLDCYGLNFRSKNRFSKTPPFVTSGRCEYLQDSMQNLQPRNNEGDYQSSEVLGMIETNISPKYFSPYKNYEDYNVPSGGNDINNLAETNMPSQSVTNYAGLNNQIMQNTYSGESQFNKIAPDRPIYNEPIPNEWKEKRGCCCGCRCGACVHYITPPVKTSKTYCENNRTPSRMNSFHQESQNKIFKVPTSISVEEIRSKCANALQKIDQYDSDSQHSITGSIEDETYETCPEISNANLQAARDSYPFPEDNSIDKFEEAKRMPGQHLRNPQVYRVDRIVTNIPYSFGQKLADVVEEPLQNEGENVSENNTMPIIVPEDNINSNKLACEEQNHPFGSNANNQSYSAVEERHSKARVKSKLDRRHSEKISHRKSESIQPHPEMSDPSFYKGTKRRLYNYNIPDHQERNSSSENTLQENVISTSLSEHFSVVKGSIETQEIDNDLNFDEFVNERCNIKLEPAAKEITVFETSEVKQVYPRPRTSVPKALKTPNKNANLNFDPDVNNTKEEFIPTKNGGSKKNIMAETHIDTDNITKAEVNNIQSEVDKTAMKDDGDIANINVTTNNKNEAENHILEEPPRQELTSIYLNTNGLCNDQGDISKLDGNQCTSLNPFLRDVSSNDDLFENCRDSSVVSYEVTTNLGPAENLDKAISSSKTCQSNNPFSERFAINCNECKNDGFYEDTSANAYNKFKETYNYDYPTNDCTSKACSPNQLNQINNENVVENYSANIVNDPYYVNERCSKDNSIDLNRIDRREEQYLKDDITRQVLKENSFRENLPNEYSGNYCASSFSSNETFSNELSSKRFVAKARNLNPFGHDLIQNSKSRTSAVSHQSNRKKNINICSVERDPNASCLEVCLSKFEETTADISSDVSSKCITPKPRRRISRNASRKSAKKEYRNSMQEDGQKMYSPPIEAENTLAEPFDMNLNRKNVMSNQYGLQNSYCMTSEMRGKLAKRQEEPKSVFNDYSNVPNKEERNLASKKLSGRSISPGECAKLAKCKNVTYADSIIKEKDLKNLNKKNNVVDDLKSNMHQLANYNIKDDLNNLSDLKILKRKEDVVKLTFFPSSKKKGERPVIGAGDPQVHGIPAQADKKPQSKVKPNSIKKQGYSFLRFLLGNDPMKSKDCPLAQNSEGAKRGEALPTKRAESPINHSESIAYYIKNNGGKLNSINEIGSKVRPNCRNTTKNSMETSDSFKQAPRRISGYNTKYLNDWMKDLESMGTLRSNIKVLRNVVPDDKTGCCRNLTQQKNDVQNSKVDSKNKGGDGTSKPYSNVVKMNPAKFNKEKSPGKGVTLSNNRPKTSRF